MNVAPQPTITPTTNPVSASYTIGNPTTTVQLMSALTSSVPVQGLTTGVATPNTGTTTCAFITSSTVSASTPGTVTVNTNFAGLPSGSYSCTIPINGTGTPAGGYPSAPTVPNGLVVNATVIPQPVILVNGSSTPPTMQFVGTTTSQPSPQTVFVSGTTGLVVTATTVSNPSTPWLTAVPVTSANGYTLTITASTTGLSAGTYSGSVTLSGTFAANVVIPVTLTVQGGNGSGGAKTNIGVWRSSAGPFFVEDANGNGTFDGTGPGQDTAFFLSNFTALPGDVAVTGDWNGSGTTKIGFYRPAAGTWYLDFDGNGVFQPGVDKQYQFGGIQASASCPGGDVPVTGDWNGSGTTKIGIFRCGFLWLLDANGNGTFDGPAGGDLQYSYGGVAGDVPVTGDWTGTGTTKIGIFRSGAVGTPGFLWILNQGSGSFIASGATADMVFAYGGIAGDVPVTGDWNGTGRTKIGVFRGGFEWVLNQNGTGSFQASGTGADIVTAFGGIAGDKPITGKWLIH
jgi:hypothetical protein